MNLGALILFMGLTLGFTIVGCLVAIIVNTCIKFLNKKEKIDKK